MAPGRSPASSSTWKPLQMPSTETAGLGVPLHRRHHRRQRRQGAAAQVVAVAPAARQHDELAALERSVLVPEEHRLLVEHVLQHVVHVVVAVAAREDDDAAPHDAATPLGSMTSTVKSSTTGFTSSFWHIWRSGLLGLAGV